MFTASSSEALFFDLSRFIFWVVQLYPRIAQNGYFSSLFYRQKGHTMQKTIKLGENTEITLENNVKWMMIYRDQFGKDIVSTLIPAMNAAIELIIGTLDATDGEISLATIAKLDADTIENAIIQVAGIEMVDLIHIVWAMCKAADWRTPLPDEWAGTLEEFPLDIIVPEIAKMLVSCMVSTKNRTRLQSRLKALGAKSTSTES